MQQPSSQQPPSQQTSSQPTTAGELKSDARQLGSKAADRLHSEVDARKGEAVSQAQSFTSAIRQTADGLDDNAPQWLRSALSQGAEQIQRFADSIESKDSRQLLSDVQSFARQRPALFLGAAAAAGFAAARIFKIGGEQQRAEQFGGSAEWDRAQPWGDGEQDLDRQFGSGSAESQPFMARSETQHNAPQPPFQEDDPLVLGTGGDAGRRLPGTGEF
jgi:hypothetical protein